MCGFVRSQMWQTFVRKCGKRLWNLIGPSNEKAECKVLLPNGKKNVVKFGVGWKEFCEENKFSHGSKLFSFTNPVTCEVHVSIVGNR